MVNVKYQITVDGVQEVKGTGGEKAVNDFLHYWTQYQNDGNKVIGKLTIEKTKKDKKND